MGFTLPRDGGAYLLAYLATEHSGNADLAGLDLSTLAYNSAPGSINRSLSSATARHTTSSMSRHRDFSRSKARAETGCGPSSTVPTVN